MNIGFTGTRLGPEPNQAISLRSLLNMLVLLAMRDWHDTGQGWRFHHGCCVGGDAFFHDAVKGHRGSYLIGHPPSKEQYLMEIDRDSFYKLRKPKDYLKRNQDIVAESDVLIAMPKRHNQRNGGTWFTIREAHRRGLPVFIIWPSGRLTMDKPHTP